MGDEDEWQKLPTEDKVTHKVWKARVAGYEEAGKRFRLIDNEKSDEYNRYAGLLKKFVIDSNAVAQEKGLEAVLAFVENAAIAGRVCGDVVSGIVQKVVNARTKTKQLGFDICMMYIEIEKQDIVMEELLKGFENKQPKIVAACTALVCQAIREFGSKVIQLKPIVKSLVKLFNHSDKAVREEVKLLSIEIYRWIRDALKTPLQGIKPVQMKELEEEWSKLDTSPPTPTRFTKSEQAKRATAPPPVAAVASASEDGPVQSNAPVTVNVDPYDLLDPVDILSQLPKDFYDKVNEKKWQERRDALEALDKLTSNPKLEPGQYGEIMGVLKKVISKDSNVVVVALGAKCVTGLAKGLRKKFTAYAPMITHVLLEKFKEKKLNVVLALRDAIDAVYQTTTLLNMMEDIQAAIENKNPNVKEETCKFLIRTFCVSTPAVLTKAVLKQLSASLIKKMDDTVGSVRDAAAEALGTALKVVGERVMGAYIDQLDKIKQEKVKEFADRAEIGGNGNGNAPATAPHSSKAAASASSAPKETKAPKADAPKKAKPNASTTAPTKVQAAPSKAKKAKAEKPAKGKKKKKGGSPYELDQEEPAEPDLSEAIVEDKSQEIFGEALITQMGNANWKERLAAVEEMTKIVEGMSGENMPSQVLVRTLAKKPGWKDSNFQVLKGKFALLSVIAKKSTFTRRSVLFAISGLILKISDVKLKEQVKETLKVFAENVSLNYVSLKVAKTADESKNPKLHVEALNWMGDALKEFGFKIDLKPHITFIKSSLQHTNQTVRGAAIQFLATVYLYVGPNLRMFFEDEKPALLQQIDAEFEKMRDQTPPAPIRRLADEEDDEEEGEDEEDSKEPESPGAAAVDLTDLVDRVDISEKLTETLLQKLADKNWKIRKEGLEEVTQILTEAKFIKSNLGELPAQLKVRLGDNNKVLVTMTISICKTLAESSGPGIAKYKEVIIPGIISTLTDKKPQLRAAAKECLDIWNEKIGFPAFLENELLSTALKTGNPTLKTELLAWLEKKIPTDKKLPSEINESIPPLFACLEDRDAEVRKNSQTLIPLIMAHAGFETMSKMANKLDAISRNNVVAILEKARETCVPIKSAKAGKGGSKGGSSKAPSKASAEAMAAAAAAMESVKDGPKEVKKADDSKKNDKGKQGTSKKAAPAAPSSKKNKKGQEEDDGPPLIYVVGKQQRIKDEKNLKVLKWNFGTPRDEIVQQLKDQMTPCVSRSFLDQLFHTDFKYHNQALTTLIQVTSRPKSGDDPPLKDALIESCDLLLKWVTLRFFDTNTSVLLKSLEFLEVLFQLMTEADYKLLDFEASAFIPYLVQKIGDPKDNVRKSIHQLFRHLTNFYPASKVFAYVMEGLQSKNSKTRMECLEEIGFLIGKFGMNVCQPSPQKALKEVATQIADRDNGVRSAALNALVAAYNIEGEKLYKLVGRLPDKDRSLLDERIKRAGKGKSDGGPTIVKPVTANRRSIDSKKADAPALQRSTSDLVASRLKPRGVSDSMGDVPVVKGEFSLDLEQIEGSGGVLQGKRPELIKVDDVEDDSPGAANKRISTGAGKATYANSAIRDIAVLLDYAISQIASSDIHKSMEALVQLEEVFKEKKEEIEMAKKVDQYIVTCFVQFKLLFTVHLDNMETQRDDVHRLLRLLISGLKELFSNPVLASAASKNAIKDTISYFISCLVEDKFSKFEDGSVIVKAVNIVLLKVIQNADRTASLGASIRLLQECIETGNTSSFMELVQKCIWKIIRLLPESIDRVKVETVLADVDALLKSCPESYWREKCKANELNPIRTMKTLLLTFVKLLGFQMLEKISFLENQEDNYIVQCVKGHLKTSGVSSRSLTKTSDSSSVARDHVRNENTDNLRSYTGVGDSPKKIQTIVGEIFRKVGSKDNTKEGLNELYEFRQKYPDEDLEPYLRNTSQFFQNYIERGLKSIELERKGTLASNPGSDDVKSQKVKTSSGTPGDSESANYLLRLRFLKERYIESMDANNRQGDATDNAGEEAKEPKMPEVISLQEEPAKPKRMDEIEELKRRLQQIKTGNLS